LKELNPKTTKVEIDEQGNTKISIILVDENKEKYSLKLPVFNRYSDDAASFVKQISNAIDDAHEKRDEFMKKFYTLEN